MYLHSAELDVSGSDKECKYFAIVMRRTYVPGHPCSLLFLAYLRFDSCNEFISALELSGYLLGSFMFEGLIIFAVTSSPQWLVRLHLVEAYVPFHPLGRFLGFRIRRLHSPLA